MAKKNLSKAYEFNIKGMDCPDCSTSIEKAISKIKGVTSAKINFETAKLIVEIESDIDTQKIIQVIRGLGYGAEEIVSGESLTLHIEGMDCADEAEVIEKKIKSLKGINEFYIHMVSGQLKIQYDSALISSQDIIKAIAETGMKASKVLKKAPKKEAWWKKTQLVLLFICGAFVLAAFILERLGVPHQFARFVYAIAILVGGYYTRPRWAF